MAFVYYGYKFISKAKQLLDIIMHNTPNSTVTLSDINVVTSKRTAFATALANNLLYKIWFSCGETVSNRCQDMINYLVDNVGPINSIDESESTSKIILHGLLWSLEFDASHGSLTLYIDEQYDLAMVDMTLRGMFDL